MLLDVVTAELVAPTQFQFVIPGDRVWQLRSVFAIAETDVGGQPDRGYTLSITDGTNLVAQIGAEDNGAEPATLTITWANAPAATIGLGAIGVTLAPLPLATLPPGYVITGEIVNPVGADAWAEARAWYTYQSSGP